MRQRPQSGPDDGFVTVLAQPANRTPRTLRPHKTR
jgi:hypothetical protein